ncbi:helix-turn-helix domain-containing protein [Limosilactobacillus vaginalis]|uniref:helix-turn-helix domain-containing protein n=1 Tax=Limosilactobacillus vaginalis TaxID=1633 RepID=UPI0025A3C427|nr:helix-turn-helix domain-containing protein [Limosilactobacillus vaginalis]MDM8243616.1 helix-turn-helix domain-containing protein [Limosilactobacillus vaginalis]
MKVATEYFSYQQAMKYLGFKSPVTLREYIQGGLPIIKIGKSKRISKSDIDKFMADHRVIATQDEGGENHD